MENQKKILLPEIILMIAIVGTADLLDIIFNAMAVMPVFGVAFIFISWFIDLVILAIIQFWFIMKGGIGFRKQAISLAGNLMEFFPFLDVLPFRTFGLAVAIYMINRPEVVKDIVKLPK